LSRVEPQTETPARSAKLVFRTTLTGAGEPYHGRGRRAGIHPVLMYFPCDWFFPNFYLQTRMLSHRFPCRMAPIFQSGIRKSEFDNH
jgi:hypothetical protein